MFNARSVRSTVQVARRGLRTLSEGRRSLLRPNEPNIATHGQKLALDTTQLDSLSEISEEERKDLMDSLKTHVQPQFVKKNTDREAALISAAIESSDDDDFDRPFWRQVVKLASDPSTRGTDDYLELFVSLFEMAKKEPDPELRRTLIFHIGRYIYGAKKVRLDPINEIEYLDSLSASGRVFQAIAIWKSRLHRKDVAGSSYWMEVGTLYYLEAGLLNTADRMAATMDRVPPRVILALIDSFVRYGNGERVEHWVSYLLDQPIETGHKSREGDLGLDLEAKLGYVPPVTVEDLDTALFSLIRSRDWRLSKKLVDRIDKNIDCSAISSWFEIPPLHRGRKCGKSGKVREAVAQGELASSEESFLPLLGSIISRDPSIVLFPSTIVALLESLINEANISEFNDVLDESFSRDVVFTDAAKALIVRRLLESPQMRFRGLELSSGEFACPEVATEVAQSLDGLDLYNYLKDYKGPIDQRLSTEIIKAGNPGKLPWKDLGLSSSNWLRIWWHIAEKRDHEPDLSGLLKSMVHAQRSPPSLNVIELISQAILSVEGSLEIHILLGFILYIEKTTGRGLPVFIGRCILTTARRIANGGRMRMLKPRTNQKFTLSDYEGPTISAEILSFRLCGEFHVDRDSAMAQAQKFSEDLQAENAK